MDADLRKHCQKRKASMLALRSHHEADWRQVADYIDPMAGKFLQRGPANGKNPSRAKIINSRATGALNTMNAGFMGGHTSKSRPWFRATLPDLDLLQRADVRAWLDVVSQRIRDALAQSNFYTELPRFYNSRHLFGVGAIACDEDPEEVVRFYSREIGTYAIALDHRGRVDSFWYGFERTARQIEQRWGATPEAFRALPRKVQDALNGGKGDQTFMVESLIEPNPDAKPGMQGPLHRPIRQVYWIDGGDADQHGTLEIGGHYEMPTLASRWDPAGASVYSSSPCLNALGDIKQLQYLEGEKLRLIDLMAKPPLTLPEYLRNKGASLNPGERIYITPMQTQQEVKAAYVPTHGALERVQAEIERVEARIERALYADLFRMLDFLDDRQRTAYEISERKEEKVAMLGPALESLTDEVLDPIVSRVYGILDRAGLIPEPPEAIVGRPVQIEYTSVLAQAQKAAGLGTIERTIAFIGGLQQMFPDDPSIRDKFDADQAIDEFHERNGGPASIIRDDEAVAALRADRDQQNQMAQMAAAMPAAKQGADALKSLAQAVPADAGGLMGLV